MKIEDLAAQRDATWRTQHPGQPEYQNANLLQEAEEELADAWNYLRAEMDRELSLEEAGGIGDAILGIESAWDDLQWVHERRKNGLEKGT